MMAQRLTRRGLVKGLGLSPLIEFASPGAVDASTPVMVEFAKYRHLRKQTDAFPVNLTDTQEMALGILWDHCILVEHKMMAQPSQTAADFAVKVIVDTNLGCLYSNWESGALWIEARALSGWGKP